MRRWPSSRAGPPGPDHGATAMAPPGHWHCSHYSADRAPSDEAGADPGAAQKWLASAIPPDLISRMPTSERREIPQNPTFAGERARVFLLSARWIFPDAFSF